MADIENVIKIVQVLRELKELQETLNSTTRAPRRWWVRPANQQRETEGYYETQFELMKKKDPEYFFQSVRMTPEVFALLLGMLQPRLERYSIRKPINPECRMFLTLMYLAHGSDHFTLSRLFRMGHSTVRQITQEVTQVIWDVLAEEYLPVLTEASWKKCSDGFYDRWDLPNCCGAVDDKHIAIQCPPNAGSLFYNYKKQHSIVLMAICDANYNFLTVDIGAYGGNSDGSVFASSEFGKRLLSNKLGLPPPTALPNSSIESPHFIVGDAAFPLKFNLMRPYPGKSLPKIQENFNRRQSKARCPIENTFGITVARWRILKSPLCMLPECAENVTKAIVVLHNFVKRHNEPQYSPPEFTDRFDEAGNLVLGEWRTLSDPLPSIAGDSITRGHNASRNAYHVRDTLAQYLTNNPTKQNRIT